MDKFFKTIINNQSCSLLQNIFISNLKEKFPNIYNKIYIKFPYLAFISHNMDHILVNTTLYVINPRKYIIINKKKHLLKDLKKKYIIKKIKTFSDFFELSDHSCSTNFYSIDSIRNSIPKGYKLFFGFKFKWVDSNNFCYNSLFCLYDLKNIVMNFEDRKGIYISLECKLLPVKSFNVFYDINKHIALCYDKILINRFCKIIKILFPMFVDKSGNFLTIFNSSKFENLIILQYLDEYLKESL